MVYINETIHRKSCELHLNTVNKTSELCKYFEKLK